MISIFLNSFWLPLRHAPAAFSFFWPFLLFKALSVTLLIFYIAQGTLSRLEGALLGLAILLLLFCCALLFCAGMNKWHRYFLTPETPNSRSPLPDRKDLDYFFHATVFSIIFGTLYLFLDILAKDAILGQLGIEYVKEIKSHQDMPLVLLGDDTVYAVASLIFIVFLGAQLLHLPNISIGRRDLNLGVQLSFSNQILFLIMLMLTVLLFLLVNYLVVGWITGMWGTQPGQLRAALISYAAIAAFYKALVFGAMITFGYKTYLTHEQPTSSIA